MTMKPVISSFIFSDDTQQVPSHGNNGSVLHIINPQNVLRPQFIPGGHSFSVSIGVLKMDPKNSHTIEFQLISPTGQIAIDTKKIEIPSNEGFDKNMPSEAGGVMINLDFRNFPFREKGEFKGLVLVDGTSIGEYPLIIFPQEWV